MCAPPAGARLGRMTETGYLFNTAEGGERARLEAQTALWDPFTFSRLEGIGVGPGWRCLELAAGTGSVVEWLCDRVGPRGEVVATELEPRWIEYMEADNLEVRRHDVVADPLEEAAFDLIHARLLLMHLPQREQVVGKLVAALRPGGWLVLEDYDLGLIGIAYPPSGAWLRVCNAVSDVFELAGADVAWGGKLAAALARAGLGDVDAEGQVLVRRPPELAAMLVPTLERMREQVLLLGIADATDFDEVMGELENPGSTLSTYSAVLVSARGRRD
jgi:SAM-dependent methyltransferase